jgi:hypothetical protein
MIISKENLCKHASYFVLQVNVFCVAGERILYLAEMPETEGRVTCELVGDAKANALNLQVFKIINYVPSFMKNTYCYIYAVLN